MALSMVLSPLISVVFRKAADSLITKICQIHGLDNYRRKLHRQLLAIQEMIADAEEHRVESQAVQEWMKDLGAAANEALDVLGEFQYEALRENAISQQPCASAKVIKDFFTHENHVVFHYKMRNKLTKVLGNIDEIVTEMNKFNFTRRDPTPAIDRETQSFVVQSDIIGRDGDKEKIVSELMDPQQETVNVSVLAIVGIGGLGKTTLAQMVYNDERIKKHFQLLMWVCVSTEFRVTNISKSILEVAINENDISISNKEVLQRRLRETLGRKKYLLVLDDVWNEEKEKWDELRTLLFFGAGSGSIIMVTTRSKEVAKIMGTLPSHDLEPLNDEDSWMLFKKRAFDVTIEEPSKELYAIGRIIVSKCVGLPLVVKAMGGLMRTKRDVHDWRAIAENNILNGIQLGNVLPILKLSYDHLPSHIKQCFAFCSIFPQDYIIQRETLIQLWMANEFIPIDGSIENIEDKGRHIFNELYGRSFFQNIREEQTDYGSIITCKMHDLMHDLAIEIAGNKCSSILKLNSVGILPSDIHHILMLGEKSPKINYILKQFPIIRTYLVHQCDQNQINEKHSYLLKSSSLRALRFGWKRPPRELRYMKHIKYLDLSWGMFKTLPETISTLYNLQTLILSHSKICKLPTEMRHMINLRHLFLDSCINLKRMPIGLEQLTSLHTLTRYVADSGKGGSIRELNNLNLLSGHMSISGLESIRDEEDAKTANLAMKTKLCSLKLEWGLIDSKEATKIDQVLLEALVPHDKLKYLAINGYSGSDFPKWTKEALIIRNLKRLRLHRCINCAELPPLWQLSLLENLYLEEMERLIHFVGGTCMHENGRESVITFPNLQVLEVKSLLNLESWHEEDSELIVFPKLNKLEIHDCPKLISTPTHAPLLSILEITNSSEIKLHQISKLPMLSYLHITADTPPSHPDAFRPPKNLEEMVIGGFENVNPLEEVEDQNCQTKSLHELTINESDCFFSDGPIGELALRFWKYFEALESLNIWFCDALVFWPEQEFKSLKCLKLLSIHACYNFTGSLQELPSPTPSGEDSLAHLESLELISPTPGGEDSLPHSEILELSSPTPGGEDSLPHLEILLISNCSELVEVPVNSKLIKDLTIDSCPKFSGEDPANFNLTELRVLEIRNCTNWIAWPNKMEHLPFLERLHISNCQGIESFPEPLQQRLSSLKCLEIDGCPILERRCRRGGEYWRLVSPIPEKKFPTEAGKNTKWKSFSRRLLCIRGR